MKSRPMLVPLIVSSVPVPLVNVTALASDVWPNVTVPKSSVDDSNVTPEVEPCVGVLVGVSVGVGFA